MSSTSERRKEIDYRNEYLKKHKGFPFKGKYLCPICLKLYSEDEIEIDHIIPLSKFGLNRVINCCALCVECNRAKSDKMDLNILKEVLLKLIEGIYNVIVTLIKFLAHIVKSMIKYPFTLVETRLSKLILWLCFLVLLLVLISEI